MSTQMTTTNTDCIRPGIDVAAFDAYLAQIHAADEARREAEIEETAAEAGAKLPMPASVIRRFEDAGAVVDLDTGWITWPWGMRTAIVEGSF